MFSQKGRFFALEGVCRGNPKVSLFNVVIFGSQGVVLTLLSVHSHTFSVSVLLNVPDGVHLVEGLVCHHLVLVEAPVGVKAGGEAQGLAGGHVDQADLQFVGVVRIVLVSHFIFPLKNKKKCFLV